MPENSRRRTVLTVIFTALATLLFLAIVTGGSHTISQWFSTRLGDTSADASPDEDKSPDAKERNRVWSTMNRDCREDPEESLEFACMVCVALRPASDDEARRYALLALLDCEAVTFEPEELNRLVILLRDAPTDTRISVLRSLAADSEYGMSLVGLTADRERLRQFLNGEQITLE